MNLEQLSTDLIKLNFSIYCFVRFFSSGKLRIYHILTRHAVKHGNTCVPYTQIILRCFNDDPVCLSRVSARKYERDWEWRPANRGSESEGTPDFSLPVRVTPRIVLEIPPPVDLRFWNKTLQKFRICVLVLWTKAVNRVSAIFIGRTTYQFLHFLRLERSILRMWFSNFSNLRYRTISRHFALTSAYSFHS